ncbi:succinylglutamate desuccinylase/aspartoacylase family protein [Mesorhizobium sp. M2C.T.Ca.TU.002.02.1.1]|uniref:succinylglutamate desuccinylase/aspartoacylase family protein n=1 Tax=Mesorhizobium sp. M2C.T.Ca.TU.002.02.1.1 TaxID=2496788 RepID=UPI000FCB2A2B|nr:succinylglutamate desuccinylase/aspartoacylase family protein [Mesorhizobium sp. M2C.T.Ca.TU.002.02.1.1]RUU56806.1 succinylglutamate desuccinylase [Mesorhizobium sp. M2C.T.Ca.TU.002.02.1.1]RUU72053.1 succinylglutamate desuccinylase [Mesorhizobium sp. M2C.T.Ca.TU.009.01.2.1]
MSDDKSMIGTNIDFDRDGLQTGTLRLPHSVHRSAYGHIAIPIAVAKNGEGPTVLLTGGVHGDEYEGPIALARLVRELDLSRLSGRLIVVPAVNYPAFVAGTRTSPIDDINLNRTFPGKRNGTATEMIAHYVTTELLPRSDYLVDFHAGGSSLQYLPTLLAPRWSDPEQKQRLEEFIDAFDPPNVVYFDSIRALSGEDRVIGNYAHQNNVFFVTGEFGGGSTVNIEGLAVVENGLRAVLSHLKVLAPAAPLPKRRGKVRRLVMDDPGLYAFAPRRGFFEPRFALGDEVPAGALAGLIYDLDNPWAEPVPVHFRHGGFAVCIRTFSLVEAGDCLGHLASPA